MERRLAICLLVFLCAVWAVAISCNNSGGDDDDDTFDDFDDDQTSDDHGDDDWDDDDTWGGCGDTFDDGTTEGEHPPELSGGNWEPFEIEVGEFDGTNYWYSRLSWSVCDLGNDLLHGGAVYFYLSGTTDQFLNDQPIEWELFDRPPEVDLSLVDDCENPAAPGITILFAEETSPPAAGYYCTDIEATDSMGAFSKLLEELCVVMPPL